MNRMPPGLLTPGRVGVMLKGRLDVMGTLDTVLQGDTEAAHVWWVLPSGKIATTGAKGLLFYGEVEAARYLHGKRFYLLETVDPMSAGQLAILQAAHQEMMQSGLARLYGLWKFLLLSLLAARFGHVSKTGRLPKTTRPSFPICSQALGYCFWKAGVPIGKSQGKEDWTAVLPETILKEAKQVTFMRTLGDLESRTKPCYYLNLVSTTYFEF